MQNSGSAGVFVRFSSTVPAEIIVNFNTESDPANNEIVQSKIMFRIYSTLNGCLKASVISGIAPRGV